MGGKIDSYVTGPVPIKVLKLFNCLSWVLGKNSSEVARGSPLLMYFMSLGAFISSLGNLRVAGFKYQRRCLP